jgi:etoposide-induced 2.4 mRNA
MNSLFTLKSMVIPTLLWILPEECDQLGGEHLCDHKVVVATYSFLRSDLIVIFYVSAAGDLLVFIL